MSTQSVLMHWQLCGNAVYYSCAQNGTKIESYSQCYTGDVAEVMLNICCDLLWQKLEPGIILVVCVCFMCDVMYRFTICLQVAVKKVIEAVQDAAVISCQCTNLKVGHNECTALTYTNASMRFGPRLLIFTLYSKKNRGEIRRGVRRNSGMGKLEVGREEKRGRSKVSESLCKHLYRTTLQTANCLVYFCIHSSGVARK